jgi:hypothetical protein
VYLKMEPDCRSDIYICIEMSGLSAWKGTGNSSDQAESNLGAVEKYWQTCASAPCDLKQRKRRRSKCVSNKLVVNPRPSL